MCYREAATVLAVLVPVLLWGTAMHVTRIDEVVTYYRTRFMAVCSCGWRGKPKASLVEAQSVAYVHRMAATTEANEPPLGPTRNDA